MSKPLHAFAPVLLLLLGMAAIPSMAAKPAAAPPPTFTNRVEFTTDGDGRVREAKVIGAPTDATNATVQQALLKKARDWRFEPFAWQGKPAASTFTRFIDVEIVPTTSGGFALRVKGVNKFKFAYLKTSHAALLKKLDDSKQLDKESEAELTAAIEAFKKSFA